MCVGGGGPPRSFCAWQGAYRRFVADVLVPIVDDPRGLVFQCPPTLRVVLPSGRALGKRHVDSAYLGHEDSEINFWVRARHAASVLP